MPKRRGRGRREKWVDGGGGADGLGEVKVREATAGSYDGEGAAELLAEGGDGGFDGFKAVAVAADVGEYDVSPAGAGDGGEEFAHVLVGEVAVAAGDALFGGPGAFPIGLEEAGAVVGFDDHNIDVVQALVDVGGDVAEVGEPRERAARGEEVVGGAGGEGEADGFLGVMGDGEGVDLKVAETETGAGLEDLPFGGVVEPGLDGAGGSGVGEDGEFGVLFEGVDAGGVVPVFVGEKNGVDGVEGGAGVVEELAEFAAGEAGIDENARAGGLQHGGIARAATAQDAETNRHAHEPTRGEGESRNKNAASALAGGRAARCEVRAPCLSNYVRGMMEWALTG